MDDYIEKALAYSLKLYRNDAQGILLIELPEAKDGNCHAPAPVALVTEHRPFESRQHTFSFVGTQAAALLPAGEYSVTVTANGYQPFRAVATVTAGNTTTVNATLQSHKTEGPTLEEILKKNRVERDVRSLRNLTVGAGQTLKLNPDSKDLSMDLNCVGLRTLEDVKQVLGVPDSVFVGETPRFGRFSPSCPHPESAVTGALNPAQRAALNEYVYGNSKSVSGWKSMLDKWVIAEALDWIIWAFLDIDVGPHAVLEVNSSGLLCNTLSVHYTGLVRFVGPGPIKVEMINYVRYGFHIIPHPFPIGLVGASGS
jgi:hypothetical protein